MTTIAIPDYLTGTWTADPAHSEISFSVRILTVGKVRGRFAGYDLTIVTDPDPLRSSVAATIELGSIDTGNERRDEHLCSADFLAVEQHPRMRYRSTGIRPTDVGWIIDGELTLHDATVPVPLAVAVGRFANGGQRAHFTATAQLHRGDFGIDRWTGGGAVIGDKISIGLNIEGVRQQ
jgi:polyisoprenoid-binding protein YceI